MTRTAGGEAVAFDVVLVVDWSSGSQPQRGANSVWIGEARWAQPGGSPRLRLASWNPSTRFEATRWLSKRLWRNAEARVLLGFDFPLGYPRGFAAAMGLMDPPGGSEPWLATLQHVAQAVVDDEANRHNRDAFAAACNARIGGGGAGPFWGCHDGAESEVLPARRLGVFDYPYAGLAEWRHADLAARKVSRPQSVWKLNQGVAVGGQTITGLPRVAELLAEDPTRRWLWPFQTGWALPHTEVGVVIAEVFPSLVPLSPRLNGPRDRVQVLSLARDLAQRDAAGTLSPRFAPPRGLDPTALNACRHEEGWILGL